MTLIATTTRRCYGSNARHELVTIEAGVTVRIAETKSGNYRIKSTGFAMPFESERFTLAQVMQRVEVA